jgi:16S rRNA C967 or C1407 C5-methylase (RsmB/RsmF family)
MNTGHKSIGLPSRFAEFYRPLLGQEADRQIQALLAGPDGKVARVIPSRFEFTALKKLVEEFEFSLPPALRDREKPKPFFEDAFFVSNELSSRLAMSTAFNEGKFYLQSAPSYLAVKHLPLQDVEYVFDMCASPGGKALHCYDRMNRQRPVIVNEPAGARRMRLTSVLKTYGADDLPLMGIDGGLLCQFVNNLLPMIILDAPCSGEAHILSQPQRRKEWTPRQTKMLAQRQLALAAAAVHALKPGGLLLYSTCALSPFENELLIQELLHRFEGALVPQKFPVDNPDQGDNSTSDISPLPRVENQEIDPRILNTAWRFRPSSYGEPFFAILLQKTQPTSPKKPMTPFPLQYERGKSKNKFHILKAGPGKREYMVPIYWPELPPLPYLHIGR